MSNWHSCTLAALLARRAPIRSTFLTACGIGQVAGMIGAWVAWSMKEFPCWLTVLIALPGIIALTQILLQLITRCS